MDTSPGQITPVRKYNKLAIVSFILAFVILVLVIYLFFRINLGFDPGPLTTILVEIVKFGTIPFGLASLLTGIIALRQIHSGNQKGAWMADIGAILGVLEIVGGFLILVYSLH